MSFLNGIHQRCQQNAHHGDSSPLCFFAATADILISFDKDAAMIQQVVINIWYILVAILLNIAKTVQALLRKIPQRYGIHLASIPFQLTQYTRPLTKQVTVSITVV
jgi:hypothetical protein